MCSSRVLPTGDPSILGFVPERLEPLHRRIEQFVAHGQHADISLLSNHLAQELGVDDQQSSDDLLIFFQRAEGPFPGRMVFQLRESNWVVKASSEAINTMDSCDTR